MFHTYQKIMAFFMRRVIHVVGSVSVLLRDCWPSLREACPVGEHQEGHLLRYGSHKQFKPGLRIRIYYMSSIQVRIGIQYFENWTLTRLKKVWNHYFFAMLRFQGLKKHLIPDPVKQHCSQSAHHLFCLYFRVNAISDTQHCLQPLHAAYSLLSLKSKPIVRQNIDFFLLVF